MNIRTLKVLLIEDDPDDTRLIAQMLKQVKPTSFELTAVDRLGAGRDYLAHNAVDAIVLDLSLPDSQGLDTLMSVRAVAPSSATVVLTGFDDTMLGIEAVNNGAQDCLVKGQVDGELLSRAIFHSVERARSAQALQESEGKFRSVIEQSDDGIVLIDEDGIIVEWNQAQERILGVARADAMGRPIWDVQFELAPDERRTPESYTGLRDMAQTLLKTGRPPWQGEVPQQNILRPDGEPRVIQATISTIKTHKGFMVSSIVRDVTEQQRAQQAVEESRQFLQYSLDALSAHVAILDEAGTIIAVNKAWRQFADANDLNDPTYGVGTNYLDVCDNAADPGSEGAEAVARGIRSALANRDNQFYLEYACHSPDEQRWFTVRLHGFDINQVRRVVVVHYNITERKLAEEALAAERNLLRTLIDHMPDRIYAKDRDGRFLIKNRSDAIQMGATAPEETVGKTDFDYYPPDLAARYQADDPMVIQFGQPLVNREEPTLNADGKEYWILTTKVPLRNNQDEIIGLVGVGRDITERKRTQERLNKLHAEINALYDISRQLGQTLDLTTIYSTVHAAITSYMSCDGLYISSYTPEDQLIRCVWAWGDGHQLEASRFPPISLGEDDEGNQSEVIRTGEPLYLPDYQARLNASAAVPIVRSDGSITNRDAAAEDENSPRSALFVPLKLENRVLGVIQVFSYQMDAYSESDQHFLRGLAPQVAAAVANALLLEQTQHEVAERERAETALRELNDILEHRIAERTAELQESEARYRAIIEDQTELICRSKADKTVTFVNDAYCRFYGLSRESCIGRTFEPYIHEEDLKRWSKEYSALTPANPVVTIEHRAMGADGNVHWMQWTNRLIMDGSGNIIEIQGVGRDITRQKKSEEVLRQALTHEMEVNEMRSRFISMASHDLRTPLAIIQASMDLFSQYGDRLSEERKRSGYQEVYRAIQQMVSLLDDILLIGRAESGNLGPEPELINLKVFCQGLITELKTTLSTRNHLNLAITGQCERLWIDPKLLRHIVSNLVSNAVKFSSPGSPVEIHVNCAPDQVLLSVEDYGIGIPIDDQMHLFETFFRGSNTENVPGNGLGLAIVRQSVELHGGSITFESRPGEGTTFFVILPCIPLEEKPDEDNSGR